MATIIGKLYSVCQTLTEVSLYLAVVVCRRDDMFQRYGVNPNRGLRKPYHIFQVKAIVTDKLLGKLIHGHIAALVLILDELGNVLSHHFSGNERLTVGKSLVMLGDLSLDVVERKIHLLGFLALAYGSVALGIPDSLGNALLATELCDSSVDCHTSHDRDNSVSLLASIYIEDCLESASHNSYFFVRCKIKL